MLNVLGRDYLIPVKEVYAEDCPKDSDIPSEKWSAFYKFTFPR
jgi:hypothetical protein